MQLLMTAGCVVAGMLLSLAVALAAEEWIFGKVLRPLFVRQAVQVKPGQRRYGAKGESKCCF